jgi:hypothetical protein
MRSDWSLLTTAFLCWPGEGETPRGYTGKSDWELGVVLDFAEKGFDCADFGGRGHSVGTDVRFNLRVAFD